MPNNDRGMVKWMPFNSIISSKKMVRDIIKSKRKISKPILSEEQINYIENEIVNAYFCKEKLIFNYYYDGKIYTKQDYIKKIDFTYHKIYLNNLTIAFEQIISVKLN